MVARSWKSPTVPENQTVFNGALVTTSDSPIGPQVTPWAATAAAVTVNGPTIDLGAVPNQRIGTLAQYVQDTVVTIPNNIEFEVQWSVNGTVWYVAPTSAQGDSRTSTIVTGAADKSIISRGQVLSRYMRWQLRTTAAGLAAGTIYFWYARI